MRVKGGGQVEGEMVSVGEVGAPVAEGVQAGARKRGACVTYKPYADPA